MSTGRNASWFNVKTNDDRFSVNLEKMDIMKAVDNELNDHVVDDTGQEGIFSQCLVTTKLDGRRISSTYIGPDVD